MDSITNAQNLWFAKFATVHSAIIQKYFGSIHGNKPDKIKYILSDPEEIYAQMFADYTAFTRLNYQEMLPDYSYNPIDQSSTLASIREFIKSYRLELLGVPPTIDEYNTKRAKVLDYFNGPFVEAKNEFERILESRDNAQLADTAMTGGSLGKDGAKNAQIVSILKETDKPYVPKDPRAFDLLPHSKFNSTGKTFPLVDEIQKAVLETMRKQQIQADKQKFVIEMVGSSSYLFDGTKIPWAQVDDIDFVIYVPDSIDSLETFENDFKRKIGQRFQSAHVAFHGHMKVNGQVYLLLEYHPSGFYFGSIEINNEQFAANRKGYYQNALMRYWKLFRRIADIHEKFFVDAKNKILKWLIQLAKWRGDVKEYRELISLLNEPSVPDEIIQKHMAKALPRFQYADVPRLVDEYFKDKAMTGGDLRAIEQEILNKINQATTEKEFKGLLREIAKKTHPDIVPKKLKSQAHEIFIRLNNALVKQAQGAGYSSSRNPDRFSEEGLAAFMEEISKVLRERPFNSDLEGMVLPHGRIVFVHAGFSKKGGKAEDGAMRAQSSLSKQIEVLEQRLLDTSKFKTSKDWKKYLDPLKNEMTKSQYIAWLHSAINSINKFALTGWEAETYYVNYALARKLKIEDPSRKIKPINFHPTLQSDGSGQSRKVILKLLTKKDVQLTGQWKTGEDEWKKIEGHDRTRDIISQADNYLSQNKFVIGIVSSSAQGLRLEGLALLEDVGDAVYLNGVAIAPWNRKELGTPQLKGVGSVLVASALQESFRRGYQGRMFMELSSVARNLMNQLGAQEYVPDLGTEADSERHDGFYGKQALDVIKKQNAFNGDLNVINQLPDFAMNIRSPADAVQTTGGIDLNPTQMNMQVKNGSPTKTFGDDNSFKFDFNGTEIDAAQVTGATFTIRTMTPVTNLPQILGLNEPVEKP